MVKKERIALFFAILLTSQKNLPSYHPTHLPMPNFEDIAARKLDAIAAREESAPTAQEAPAFAEAEEDWFEGRKEIQPSERAETAEQRFAPKKAKPTKEPSVIVNREQIRAREAAKEPKVVINVEQITSREKEKAREMKARETEQVRETKVREIRQKLRGTGIEKIARRSENERSLAADIIQEMRTHIEKGEATEKTLEHYRRELKDLQNHLEDLQAQLRERGPGSGGMAAMHELNELQTANFETLNKIATALHASKLEQIPAIRELAPFTSETAIPQEEKSATLLETEIEAKYGADPEALRAGGGPFWKRQLFNFRHWLAEKTNQKSEYDLYRDAKSREYRMREAEKTEQRAEPLAEAIPAPPESVMKGVRKREQREKEITVEDARTLVPRARQLWDFANRRFFDNPSAVAAIDIAARRAYLGKGQAPATEFVLLIAKYLDARDNLNDDKLASQTLKDIRNVSSSLGAQGSPLIEQALAASKAKTTDVARGPVRRRATAAEQ